MRYHVILALFLLTSFACSSVTTTRPDEGRDRTMPTFTVQPAMSVTQTMPTATVSQTRLTFEGRSNQATDLFSLSPGLVRFDMYHDGESNFIVKLLDQQGNYIALVGNSIGKGNTSKAIKIERTGRYLLDITADGAWTISVSQ